MTIDEDRILRKIAYIRHEAGAIRELTRTFSREEILNDPWKMRGIRYSLQTAIEAMIDIAYHLAAKMYNYPPVDARDAFQTLRHNGVISSADFDDYAAMVGFRNRLVHGYQEISPERLYGIITSRLGDCDKFVETVTSLVSKKQGDANMVQHYR